MRRLLWKEWHEIRWYLIGLVLGPWLLTLWPPTYTGQIGNNYLLDSNSERVQILLIILMFWGATRLSGENRPGRLTTRNLPANQWTVLVSKFLPGFMVACLMPLWIHFAVITQIHPAFHAVGGEYSRYANAPFQYISGNFWLLVSAYLVSFALSTFSSSVVALLIGWLLVFFGAVSIMHSVIDGVLRAFLAMAALIAAPALWLKGTNAGPRRKIGIGVVSILVTIPIFLAGLYLCWIMYWQGNLRNPLYAALPMIHGRSPEFSVLNSGAEDTLSPDGRLLAYTSQRYALNKHVGGRTIYTTKVLDFQHRKTLLEQKDARPITWLPDGKLLIAALGKNALTLLEWDPDTGKRHSLLTYPCDSAGCPIMRILPSPDARKIALFITPRRVRGTDIWMLDRRSRKLQLIRPGLTDWEDNQAWDGDRLVFQWDNNEYWSMKSDGSDLKRIRLGGPLCADF